MEPRWLLARPLYEAKFSLLAVASVSPDFGGSLDGPSTMARPGGFIKMILGD